MGKKRRDGAKVALEAVKGESTMAKNVKGWLSNIFGSKKEQEYSVPNQQAAQSISDDEFFKPGGVIGSKFEIHS